MEEIKISVRNLVEFILRGGDIDNRHGGLIDKEAMQLGSKLHRKIQGQMGASYRAEVALKHSADCGNYVITVEGRADGILSEDGKVTVDEIKGIYKDLALLKEPLDIHLAQAKCYAYIYGYQEELKNIQVQMTYCNLETEDIRRFLREYSFEELEHWFCELMEEYRKWCEYQISWKAIRQESIREVEFPFPYRNGQKDLATAVYRTIWHRKKLFIQAPTGVGKTISAIFPAVKAVGEGLGEKIFYLTAKTITRTVAAEAFTLLKNRGLRYKVVTLTAKEKICACDEMDCNPEHCPFAKGHYDRINDAVYDMVTNYSDFSRDALLAQSEKWQVCPFELSLDVSLWVDAVICDYNYVFDPRARLKRFFGEGMKRDYIFLIDEAHNLVERGREMYSAALLKEDFMELRKEVKSYSKKLNGWLGKCNRIMLDWKRECETYEILENLGNFSIVLMNLCGEMEEFLEGEVNQKVREQALDLYFSVRSFLDVYDKLDENYVAYTELQDDGKFKVKLYCVDTAVNLQECMDRGRSTIFFSATLLPVDYYIRLLSKDKDDYAIYASSPFDVSRKEVLIGADVSSKYTKRSLSEYQKMASYIQIAIEQRKGNYMTFFPSYKMMEEVADCFEKIKEEKTVVLRQSSGMREREREEFLEAFERTEEAGQVGFCVMGGIFGEGIDLKHDRLIGVIIVGTGLPQVCNEREILKNYYDVKQEDGFAYAYQYPGMNKVLQSAGRVIRTQEDEGVILLLDDRFLQQKYREMFPREWQNYMVCNLRNIGDKIKDFWNRGGGERK